LSQVYVDTSFLISIYVTDRHSSTARQRILTAPPPLLTPLHEAEWAHALAQLVFRQQLSVAEAKIFDRQLQSDKADGVWQVGNLTENTFETCADLGRRYGARLGVRTLDSLHVACALESKAMEFWTFDDRQTKLAKVTGLRTA